MLTMHTDAGAAAGNATAEAGGKITTCLYFTMTF